MTKPLCPHNDEFGHPCKRQMYALHDDLHPSNSTKIIVLQCFSMNDKHKVEIKEPIPGWDSFREMRNEIVPACGRRLTEKDSRN